MRVGLLLSRTCFRSSGPRLRPLACRQQYSTGWTRSSFKDRLRRNRTGSSLLLATALSPAAFIEISEHHEDGKSGEEQMLEASREEIDKKVPDDMHGMKRLSRNIWMILDQYVYEPIATSLRLLHLVIIFVPVIVTVPAVWIGKRRKERHGERSGTLWWYSFLVSSMERAGPAFIKVCVIACLRHCHELTSV